MSDMLEYQRQLSAANEAETEQEAASDESVAVSPQAASAMLAGPMAGVQRRALVQNMGQTLGNKGVQRMLSEVRRTASGAYGRSAASGPEGGSLEDDLANAVQAERANGQALPDTTRSSIERALGHDMSQLRVSVNPGLNAAMGAKAFTSGRNVVLRDSADMNDMGLLTHEATHAVQQGFSETKPSSIGGADTAHEHEAEHNASHASAGGVQRDAQEDEVAMMRDTSIQREGDEEEMNLMRDGAVQREGDEEEMNLMRDGAIQREGDEEEMNLMRDGAIQREGDEEEMNLMRDGAIQREGDEEEMNLMRDGAIQREGDEEEMNLMRDGAIQREGDEEEMNLMRDNAVQREGDEEEMNLMRDNAVQREGDEEEMNLMRDGAIQREGDEEEMNLMRDGDVQREGDEEEMNLMRDNAVQREAEGDEEMA